MRHVSPSVLTGNFDDLPGFYGEAVNPRIAEIYRRSGSAPAPTRGKKLRLVVEPASHAAETPQASQPTVSTEQAQAIQSALHEVLAGMQEISEKTADETKNELLELTPALAVDRKSPFFAALARNIHAKMPSKAQIINARRLAMGWVRENGPLLFATGSASFAMGHYAPELLAQFRLNALIATVPGFTEAMAAKAVTAVAGVAVGLTGPAVELMARALRPAQRKNIKPRAFAKRAGHMALLSAVSRTLAPVVGSMVSTVTLLGETIAKVGAFTIGRALGLKKKEQNPFDKKAFFTRLALSLATGAISALAGYHLRSRVDALAVADAAPEPIQTVELMPSHNAADTHSTIPVEPVADIRPETMPAHRTLATAQAAIDHAATNEIARERAIEAAAATERATRITHNEIDRERLQMEDPRYQAQEHNRSHDMVQELPPIKMPERYAAFMSAKMFHTLPREVQELAANAVKNGNPAALMLAGKEMAYSLSLQNTTAGHTTAAKLIENSLTLAWNGGLLETDIGRKLNADMAYYLATGKGGIHRDFNKAAYHMLLGQGTKTSNDVEKILVAKAPETLQAVRSDYARFRVEDVGLTA